MEILYLLIPLAVVVMAGAIWALIWAIKNGQYDDLEGPAHRILMDDDDPRIPGTRTSSDTDESADGESRLKQRH